jgi:hypothetical protein
MDYLAPIGPFTKQEPYPKSIGHAGLTMVVKQMILLFLTD